MSADVVEQAFEKVMDEHGAIHVRRAYCTAESAVKNLQLFKRLSIRPIVNLSTGKNSTDIALAVDAIDLVIAERPDVVVIVSSDSDFAPLVIRLREKGCRVEGIGQEGKTGDDAKPVYDSFVDLHHGRARAGEGRRPARARARRQARAAWACGRRGGGAGPEPPPPPRRGDDRQRARRGSAARLRRPSRCRLPKDVQEIIDAVPQLRGGGWVELGLAAEPLRKAKLLGKTAASTKLFKKHAAHFALQSEKQPHQVRFLGAERADEPCDRAAAAGARGARIMHSVKRARPPLVQGSKGGTGGRSGLHRAAQQLTAVHREVRIRATETSQGGPVRVFCEAPAQAGGRAARRGPGASPDWQPPRRASRLGETGNLCAQQHQIGTALTRPGGVCG